MKEQISSQKLEQAEQKRPDLNTASLSLNKEEEQKVEDSQIQQEESIELMQLQATVAKIAELNIDDQKVMEEHEALVGEYRLPDNTVRVVGELCMDVLSRLNIKPAQVKEDPYVMQKVLDDIMGDQNFVASCEEATMEQVAELIMSNFDSKGGWWIE